MVFAEAQAGSEVYAAFTVIVIPVAIFITLKLLEILIYGNDD